MLHKNMLHQLINLHSTMVVGSKESRKEEENRRILSQPIGRLLQTKRFTLFAKLNKMLYLI